jgi:hypothetical protein
MFLKFVKDGQWWLCSKLNSGKLDRYSFVWPLVFQWFKDVVSRNHKEK